MFMSGARWRRKKSWWLASEHATIVTEARNPHAGEINKKRKALSALAWLQVVVDVIVGGWELQHGCLCGCMVCMRKERLKTLAPLVSREVLSSVLIASVTEMDWRFGITTREWIIVARTK